MYNPAAAAVANELASDMWIQQNVPGGLNSPLGQALDNTMGGNPNPTFGQALNSGFVQPVIGVPTVTPVVVGVPTVTPVAFVPGAFR